MAALTNHFLMTVCLACVYLVEVDFVGAEGCFCRVSVGEGIHATRPHHPLLRRGEGDNHQRPIVLQERAQRQ